MRRWTTGRGETCCADVVKDSRTSRKLNNERMCVKAPDSQEMSPKDNSLRPDQAIELKGIGAISSRRGYTHPRNDSRSCPKEILGCETKIGPALEVLVTERCSQYGVEIKDDSLARDGSQSWVVICRGVERLVRELCLSIALNQCGRTISH